MGWQPLVNIRIEHSYFENPVGQVEVRPTRECIELMHRYDWMFRSTIDGIDILFDGSPVEAALRFSGALLTFWFVPRVRSFRTYTMPGPECMWSDDRTDGLSLVTTEWPPNEPFVVHVDETKTTITEPVPAGAIGLLATSRTHPGLDNPLGLTIRFEAVVSVWRYYVSGSTASNFDLGTCRVTEANGKIEFDAIGVRTSTSGKTWIFQAREAIKLSERPDISTELIIPSHDGMRMKLPLPNAQTLRVDSDGCWSDVYVQV